MTTDDVILAGFAAEDQYRGKLKVVGKGFSDELYGIGIKKGDTAMVTKVNAALKQYIDDGSWAEVAGFHRPAVGLFDSRSADAG